MSETTPDEQRQPFPQEPVHTCPLCQYALNKPIPEATEEERKEYVRCLMSGNQFTKKYELYDGELKLMFSNIDTDAAETMSAILREVDTGEDVSALMSAVARIRLLYYLRSFNDKEYPAPEVTSLEEARAMFSERFGGLSEDLTSIFVRASSEFNNLLTVLVQSGFDRNFWKGAGLS
jgi:hypothetical protein